MMTSSNGNIFRAPVICAGNSSVSVEFPAQRLVTRSFDVFFGLRLNKPLSKQWWGWWFETLSCTLWRHCNDAPALRVHQTSLSISVTYCDQSIQYRRLIYWQRLTEIRGLNKCSFLLVYLSEADRKYPNSKIHGANMGPVWGRHDPGGSHVGPMNFGIWVWSFLSRPAGNIPMNTINVWRVTYH